MQKIVLLYMMYCNLAAALISLLGNIDLHEHIYLTLC